MCGPATFSSVNSLNFQSCQQRAVFNIRAPEKVTQVPQESLSDLAQLSWNHEEAEDREHRSRLAHQWIRDLVAHAALRQFCPEWASHGPLDGHSIRLAE